MGFALTGLRDNASDMLMRGFLQAFIQKQAGRVQVIEPVIAVCPGLSGWLCGLQEALDFIAGRVFRPAGA